jgi:hypothetical protein
LAWYTRRKYRELEVGESPFILWIFFRGQVLTKAGTEETILYSDIGKLCPAVVMVSGAPTALRPVCG